MVTPPRGPGRPPRPRLEVDLRAMREAAGLSGRAAAARAGVPWSTWRAWEAGRFPPPPAEVERLMVVLQAPEDGMELEAG